MDRIGYEETLKVSYFQIDGNRNMSPAALLSCLQEAAVTHSDTIGYTLDYMAEHQWGWSVVNWHLQIYRMPQHGERIQVQTWSNKCMRFQAERSFFLFDEAGNKLLDGASRWIFMDLARRRPANAPDGMAERYHSGQEPAIPDEKFFMLKEAEGDLLSTRTLPVTRRDTDTNGHANNVKYLEWAMCRTKSMTACRWRTCALYTVKNVYAEILWKSRHTSGLCLMGRKCFPSFPLVKKSLRKLPRSGGERKKELARRIEQPDGFRRGLCKIAPCDRYIAGGKQHEREDIQHSKNASVCPRFFYGKIKMAEKQQGINAAQDRQRQEIRQRKNSSIPQAERHFPKVLEIRKLDEDKKRQTSGVMCGINQEKIGAERQTCRQRHTAGKGKQEAQHYPRKTNKIKHLFTSKKPFRPQGSALWHPAAQGGRSPFLP